MLFFDWAKKKKTLFFLPVLGNMTEPGPFYFAVACSRGGECFFAGTYPQCSLLNFTNIVQLGVQVGFVMGKCRGFHDQFHLPICMWMRVVADLANGRSGPWQNQHGH